MAKKKKHEEHVNLERWLVSYGDFITLLFATFVVLYALAQADAAQFDKLEEAMKKAFSTSNVEDGGSVFDKSTSLFEGVDQATNPLMLEYLSPKYEEQSYEEVKKEINKLKNSNINASVDDRGLVIKLSESALNFEKGKAVIPKSSYVALNNVGEAIKSRFAIHVIRVEGHTDSESIHTAQYPSNWELSSARASSVVRYLIDNFNFSPKIFIAAGYSDTVPFDEEKSKNKNYNKSQDRRVEIVVLRNKYSRVNNKDISKIIDSVKKRHSSTSVEKQRFNDSSIQDVLTGTKPKIDNPVDIKQVYSQESSRLKTTKSGEYLHDSERPEFME